MKSLNTAFVGLWGALGRIALAMLLALALPLAAVGAYGETTDPADDTGDTGDTTDDDTTGDDDTTTTTSSGGGGGGGGGGGSYRSVRDEEATIPAATEQSCSALLVSDVSPDRDEVAQTFNQISFTVAGDVDLTSIIITVDGTDLEAAVELVGTQTYRISAEIIPPLSSAGEHLVFFSVSSATSANCTDARSYSVFVPEPEVETEEQPTEEPADQEQLISSYAQLAADTFLDISKNFWAAEAVGKLFEQGVVSGTRTAGGLALFRPADSVNRAEAAKLSATAFGLAIPVRGRTSFSDVPADQWYAPFFSALQGAGVLQGYADGTARPAQVMTRAEALKIAFQSVGIEPASVSGRTFVDLGPQHWAAPYAELAQALDVIGGYPIGEGDRFIAFRPEQAITRAEFAAVVARVQDAVGAAPQG